MPVKTVKALFPGQDRRFSLHRESNQLVVPAVTGGEEAVKRGVEGRSLQTGSLVGSTLKKRKNAA